jgi:hypothetical protein
LSRIGEYGSEKKDQVVAVRSAKSKMILNSWRKGGRIFYDLTKDPNETRARKRLPPNAGAQLVAQYREWSSETPGLPLATETELDDATRRGLKSLGYLRGD